MTQWNNWWIDYDRNGSFVCVYERKRKKNKVVSAQCSTG